MQVMRHRQNRNGPDRRAGQMSTPVKSAKQIGKLQLVRPTRTPDRRILAEGMEGRQDGVITVEEGQSLKPSSSG
jgi:hypothetical protein